MATIWYHLHILAWGNPVFEQNIGKWLVYLFCRLNQWIHFETAGCSCWILACYNFCGGKILVSESLGGKAGKTTRNLDGFEPGHAQSLARCHPLMICHGHLSSGSGVSTVENMPDTTWHDRHWSTGPLNVDTLIGGWPTQYLEYILLIYG